MSTLVIRSLKASAEIEASDKAYFAAEGGMEDALYELSAHSAGYETAPLQSKEVRNDRFSEKAEWRNEWELKGKGQSNCLENDWENNFLPTICGTLGEEEKLVISLFNDKAEGLDIKTNKINIAAANVQKININLLEIKFRVSKKTIEENLLAAIYIDNDKDYKEGIGLNEDSGTMPPTPCDYSNGLPVADNDCDQKEDEDSPEDPVLIWKVIDNQGNAFQPLRGCKNDPPHPSHNQINAGLCEKNFVDQGNNELSLSLNESDLGIVQSKDPNKEGAVMSLVDFIAASNPESPLQIEILQVAPMKTINDQKEVLIPFYEYGIQYDADEGIPNPYFLLKTDGYFQNYKQSITAKVVPGTTTRLLDLAIIQQ